MGINSFKVNFLLNNFQLQKTIMFDVKYLKKILNCGSDLSVLEECILSFEIQIKSALCEGGGRLFYLQS